MKANYLILVIGVLGIVYCGYAMILQKDISTSFIGFISGTSLIWGYYNLKKAKKSNA
jgi:hypothetical protein